MFYIHLDALLGVIVGMLKLYLSVSILANRKSSRRNLKKTTKAGSMLLQRNGWVLTFLINLGTNRWRSQFGWQFGHHKQHRLNLSGTLWFHIENRTSFVPTI